VADALDLLVADHREVDRLASAYEKLSPGHVRRREIAEEITEALSIHAGVEELVFYPAVRQAAPELDDTVLEALEEHHLVKSALAELTRTSLDDERFDAKLRVLLEIVRHHVEEEEGELFPAVRKRISDVELRELGRLMEDARALAPRMPHPHAPDQPPQNTIATLLTMPLDIVGRTVRRVLSRSGG
jgi:hemerythrin superfamily protein